MAKIGKPYDGWKSWRKLSGPFPKAMPRALLKKSLIRLSFVHLGGPLATEIHFSPHSQPSHNLVQNRLLRCDFNKVTPEKRSAISEAFEKLNASCMWNMYIGSICLIDFLSTCLVTTLFLRCCRGLIQQIKSSNPSDSELRHKAVFNKNAHSLSATLLNVFFKCLMPIPTTN